MKTVREVLQRIYDETVEERIKNIAEIGLHRLNDSREMTEKVTTIVPHPNGGRDGYKVKNHKARVVLDD